MGKVGPRDPGLEEGQGLFATLHARVSYVGVPAAVFKIMDVGRGTFKAKFDLRHPCRLLLVNVEDRNFFLGMRWRDQLYIDQFKKWNGRACFYYPKGKSHRILLCSSMRPAASVFFAALVSRLSL